MIVCIAPKLSEKGEEILSSLRLGKPTQRRAGRIKSHFTVVCTLELTALLKSINTVDRTILISPCVFDIVIFCRIVHFKLYRCCAIM